MLSLKLKMHQLHHMRILLCLALVLVCVLSRNAHAAAENKYVVNLLSMKQDISLDKVKNLSSIKDRYNIVLYRKPLNDGNMNVLSVGYFSSYDEASKVAGTLDRRFNGAYVSKFRDGFTEQKTISAQVAAPQEIKPKHVIPKSRPAAVKTSTKNASTLSDERLDQIMVSARKAILSGDNRNAIQLFSAVLTAPENKHSIEALELLGLARERNGQYNHAVNIYNKYIKLYPQSKGIRRVRQRLAVLTTATKRIDSADQINDAPKVDRPWNTFGSLSQSYRNNDGEESELYTYLSVDSRKANDGTDIELSLKANRTSPLSGDTETDFQISEMYADVQFTNSGLSTQLGRIRTRSGGLYGRLDGLILGYDDMDSTRYNFMYGLPVDRSREQLFDSESDKLVYGVNAELLFLDKSLNVIPYLVEQRNDGLLDRQAVGTELRYYNSDLALFSLLDYDTSYDQMSIFLLTGNWKTADNLTLFFNLDYRSSPLLKTGNAVIGQTETDLGTLAAALGEDAVRQLAEDRTSTSKLFSMGASWPISNATTVRTDITASTISATPETGGVPATPEIGPDYYYSLQYVSTNFFDLKDTSILQFQFADTEAYKKLSTLGSVRIPVTNKLKITPKAVLAFTDLEQGENRTELRTSLRADYRYSRDLYLDADLSVDYSDVELAGSDGKKTVYYFIATYRWLF